MNLLHDLYFGNYVGAAEKASPAERRLIGELELYCEQIRAALGEEFLDRLLSLEADLSSEECLRAFSGGVQLGGQMVLAVMGEATTP